VKGMDEINNNEFIGEQVSITDKSEWFAQNIGIVKVFETGLNLDFKENNTPYFVILPVDKNRKTYKVKIPLKYIHELTADDIITSEHAEINEKEKEEIINWLKLKNVQDKNDYGVEITNLKSIIITWRRINGFNISKK
jgi:hypothetical protein